MERVPALTALQWVAEDPRRNVLVCATDYSLLHKAALYISKPDLDCHEDIFYSLLKDRGAERVLFHCDHSNSRGPATAAAFLRTLQRKKDDTMRLYVIDHGNRAWEANELQLVREQANKAAHAAGLRRVNVVPQDRLDRAPHTERTTAQCGCM